MYIIVTYHRETLNLARYIGPFETTKCAEKFIEDELTFQNHLVFEVAPLFPL